MASFVPEDNEFEESGESNDKSTDKMNAINNMDVSDQSDFLENESSEDWRKEDICLSKSYLMFENNANLCWLDSSMSLLCHNKTLSHLVDGSSSIIANVMKGYENAISILNDYSNDNAIEERLQTSKNILEKVQGTVLEYLTPILKCKEGEPDSAFCSLLNLISEDKRISDLFCVEFSSIRNCTKCTVPRVRNNKKTIITLSNVKSFDPSSPVSLYKCAFCNSADQEMAIKFKTLPQTLLFHFENGAGEGELENIDFQINDRRYKLSGLIKLEKSRDLTVSHFVTWVRDIATDSWLECNDLNNDISSFSVVPPLINLKDLYIVMYEALDNKGTLTNAVEDADSILKLDTDDTNSSDIPVIDLGEEDTPEINQDSEIGKEKSETGFLGGLFKPDKTDYDSIEKTSSQLDNVLIAKSIPESSENLLSEIEKISVQNSELQNLDLQDSTSSTSSIKIDEVPLEDESSISAGLNSQNDGEIDPKNTVENTKQSPIKDNIEMWKRDESKPLISSDFEMASLAKHLSDSAVKVSESNGKPLIGTTNFENNTLIDTNDVSRKIIQVAKSLPVRDHANASNSSSKKSSPNAVETQDDENSKCSRKNLTQSEDSDLDLSVLNETDNCDINRNISSSKNATTPFKNHNNGMNADTRASPVKPQNSKLERNISLGENKLNVINPIKVTCVGNLDAMESCVGTSSLASSQKQLKKKIKTDNRMSKKSKTINDERFMEDDAVDFIDNIVAHDDEKTIETSTLRDLTLHSSSTQNDNLETKTRDTITSFSIGSPMLNGKASENPSFEVFKETKSISQQNNVINNVSSNTLNPPDEENTLNLLENKEYINITGTVATNVSDNSVTEEYAEDVKNLTIKQNNAQSEQSIAPNVSENNYSSSSIHQATILDNAVIKQPEDTIAPSSNLNVQLIENRIVDSEKLTRELEEKNNFLPQNQAEVKNFPSKNLSVKLTRLKDSEIADYVSGSFSFKGTKHTKSLEELTKTIVVKVEKTDSKSILKRTAKQAGPSKVESTEKMRKSSRISARKIKKEKINRYSPEPMRSNSQKHTENNAYTKSISKLKGKNTIEVFENTLEIDLPKSTDISSGVHLQKTRKKRNSTADEGLKSKRPRTNPLKAENFNIESHLPSPVLFKSTSSTQEGKAIDPSKKDSPISSKKNNATKRISKTKHQTIPVDVTENTLKTNLPKITDVSNGAHLQKIRKKRNSTADEGVKSKPPRKNSFKGNISIESHLPSPILPEGSSSTQDSSVLVPSKKDSPISPKKNNSVIIDHPMAVHTGNIPHSSQKADVLLKVTNSSKKDSPTFTKKNNSFPVDHPIAVHTEDIPQASNVLQSRENGESCDENFSVHELIEHSANWIFADIFKFFNLQKNSL